MRNHSLIVGVTLCRCLVALAACCLALCGARVQGQQLGRSTVDSLLWEAEHAESCAARLEAWESLSNCYYAGRDSILLLGALSQMESTARTCGDVNNYLYARMWRLTCYYNYSMRDSFFMMCDESLRLFTRYKQDRFRYEVYRLRIQYYLFNNELRNALREAECVVRMANDEGEGYGLGVSHFCLGDVLQMQYMYETAVEHYSEALNYLSKDAYEHIELRLRCFERLADCYATAERYERLDSLNRLWKKEFVDHGIDMYDDSADNPWRVMLGYFYLSQAHYHLESGGLEVAHKFLDTAERFIAGEELMLVEQEAWYKRAGLYDSALAKNDRLLAKASGADLARSEFDHKQARAQILFSMGNFREAARLYDSLLSERNLIFKATAIRSTMDLASMLEAERTRRAELKGTLYLFIGGTLAAFCGTLALTFLYESRKTLRKNRMLVEKVERLELTHGAISELQRQQGFQRAESKEHELYERLELLMRERHPYLDPRLNRDTLARELFTNTTYLANAIKQFRPGVTVGSYIAQWRVAYAAHLLHMSSLRINEVARQSGFVSRVTMNRAFNECYGMSPSEYREALRNDSRGMSRGEPLQGGGGAMSTNSART